MKLVWRSAFVAAAMVGLSTLPSRAVVIANCGLNPAGCGIASGGTGLNGTAAGAFTQDVTFSVGHATNISVTTTQSAESGLGIRYINPWQLAIYAGTPPSPAGGLASGPVAAVTTTGAPPNNQFQTLDLIATLSAGTYFLEFTGVGGTAASFNGQLSTFGLGNQGVPGPIAGAGLPGLFFALVGGMAWWRRRRPAGDNAMMAA